MHEKNFERKIQFWNEGKPNRCAFLSTPPIVHSTFQTRQCQCSTVFRRTRKTSATTVTLVPDENNENKKHEKYTANRQNHINKAHTHTHTRLTALCPRLSGWAGTRKVKPIWILLKQETVSGSGISWAKCKSAPRSRQITMPAPHHSDFYRPDALPAAQPIASKHWRNHINKAWVVNQDRYPEHTISLAAASLEQKAAMGQVNGMRPCWLLLTTTAPYVPTTTQLSK